MPGFFTVIDYTHSKNALQKDKFFNASMHYTNQAFTSYIYSDGLDKFLGDKIFYQDDNLILVIEGVIFNKKELILPKHAENWINLVIELYKKEGKTFYKNFKGSYSGFIFDKQNDEWVTFTDPIGDKQVFVFTDKDLIVFGSEIKHFLSLFKLNKITYTFDETAAYMLLSYGFFLENFTLFKEIRKLKAGHCFYIKNSEIKFVRYHQFNNEPNWSFRNKTEIFDLIDWTFRDAVKRQFDKDLEYGYKHIAGLSGGLDSRMTTWVAHELGYRNVLNFTFSQSDYLDEIIAKNIARDLQNEWIFKSLDNGSFLIEELNNITNISYGGALYYGLAHSKSLLDIIDFSKYGIIHTGQLGDVILATDYKKEKETTTIDIKAGSYSTRLIKKIASDLQKICNEYANNEIFKFYSRYFNGTNQGLLVGQQRTETFSPFYDIDFMEMCLTIPGELRSNHNIYIKWLKAKYPKAARYKWESIGASVLAPSIKIKGKQFYIPQFKKAIRHKFLHAFLGDKITLKASKNSMNPLDYWYNTNKALQFFMDNYYQENLQLLNNFSELQADVQLLYGTGRMSEKNQVLTLLAAVKTFFT